MVRTTVLKFGGSSQEGRNYANMVGLIISSLRKWDRIYVVVSAIGDTTSQLVKLWNSRDEKERELVWRGLDTTHCTNLSYRHSVTKLREEITKAQKLLKTADRTDPYQMAEFLSYGERFASIKLEHALREGDHVGTRLGSVINSYKSDINPATLSNRYGFYVDTERLSSSKLNIVDGFWGTTLFGKCILLGKNGGDTTASLIANAVDAEQLEIWTVSDGIYTADPKLVPHAKLIKRMGYSMCQELAAMDTPYLIHPYGIRPCQQKNIPILIRNIRNPLQPEDMMTRVENENVNADRSTVGFDADPIAIRLQKRISVICIESLAMWETEGFVEQIGRVLKKHRVSVDILNSSQFTISITTDEPDQTRLDGMITELTSLGYRIPTYVKHVDLVSIVTNDRHRIKNIHKGCEIATEIGECYLDHMSSNRLSVSFAVPVETSLRLVKRLHYEFVGKQTRIDLPISGWWDKKLPQLIELGEAHDNLIVYDLDTIRERCRRIKKLGVDRYFFAMKSNWNSQVLETIMEEGFGIETVSVQEMEHIKMHHPKADVLFTPNYAPIEEYQKGFELGVHMVIDNLKILQRHSHVFAGREIGLRIDCNMAEGHDSKVLTEGDAVKFGIPLGNITRVVSFLAKQKNPPKIVGLHSHRGSGIMDPTVWTEAAKMLIKLAPLFPDLGWINLGGGFGVPSLGREPALDLDRLKDGLNPFRDHPYQLWVEPGRFLVAEAGVILSRATQVRKKGAHEYVGIGVGMNTLIRPALYNSWHPYANLTRYHEPRDKIYTLVGPICESGDSFGKGMMPKTREDDTIIITMCGAYVRVMSSCYNMRSPPKEVAL